jgi:hypothetical protein
MIYYTFISNFNGKKMKYVLLLIVFLIFNPLISQVKYSKNQEVMFFDGLDWIESKVVDVDADGKCLVYSNRQKSKTKWVTSEDLQAIVIEITDNVEQIRINIEESQEIPVLKISDEVKFMKGNNEKWIFTEILEINDENYLVYEDETKSTKVWKSEAELVLLNVESDREFKTRKTKKTIVYRVNDEVLFNENGEYLRGIIEKINTSDQFFISGKWYEMNEVTVLEK